MAFGVDTSHVPNIPGLSTVVSTPVSGISSSAKDLMTTLVEDRASLFANPMVNVLTTVNGTIDQLTVQIADIASGNANNLSITANDATAFLAGTTLLDLQTSLGNLLSHTNRLSGVLKGAGINTPGLEEIISVGKQMNDYVNLLNAGSGCLSMIGGATGLFSQDELTTQNNNILGIIDAVSRGTATTADIAEALSSIKNIVDGIISKDSQFLTNCVTQLQSAALAMGLEYVYADPCAKFLMETVANRNPGGLLTKLVRPIGV